MLDSSSIWSFSVLFSDIWGAFASIFRPCCRRSSISYSWLSSLMVGAALLVVYAVGFHPIIWLSCLQSQCSLCSTRLLGAIIRWPLVPHMFWFLFCLSRPIFHTSSHFPSSLYLICCFLLLVSLLQIVDHCKLTSGAPLELPKYLRLVYFLTSIIPQEILFLMCLLLGDRS